MRIFKTRVFSRWASKEGMSDASLIKAINEMNGGLIDADLGSNVYKKRIAGNGRGKSGGRRTVVAYKSGNKAFFVYGFAKNARANITQAEFAALKRLAKELLNYSEGELKQAIKQSELIQVSSDD